MILVCLKAHLNAGLVERHAKPVGVLAVVFHKLLQRAEGGAARDEEPALVELADAVVLHCVAVADWSNTKGYIVVIGDRSTGRERKAIIKNAGPAQK